MAAFALLTIAALVFIVIFVAGKTRNIVFILIEFVGMALIAMNLPMLPFEGEPGFVMVINIIFPIGCRFGLTTAWGKTRAPILRGMAIFTLCAVAAAMSILQ